MSYGSDYLREAMTLNERKVNNKKSLKESIEDKKQPLKEENTKDIKNSVYNFMVNNIFDLISDNLHVSVIASEIPSYDPEWCSEEEDPRLDNAVKQLAMILTEECFKNM